MTPRITTTPSRRPAGAGVVPHPTDNHYQVPALDVHDHLVRPAPPLPTLHRLIVYPRATTGTPLAHTHYYSYTPSGHTHRYVQYLGFYSQLNVPWPAGLMSLFKGFSFFNLSLEAIHLTCGGLAYTDIWMLQMVLPLFYPAAALVNIAADLLLAAAKPKWLMGLGWRPQRDFTLKAHTIDREIDS